MKVALAGLLACLTMAACGEAVAPTATAPAASVAPAPTATATPAPDPAASIAPAPASTATATSAPEEPDDFLEAALERMAEAGSVAFVMRMEMQAETEEGLRSASAVYTGDSRGFAYTTGMLAVNGLADATEARFAALDTGLYEARYALDNDTQTWSFAEPLPEFMQLSHFLAPGKLVQEGFLPPQTLNGVEMRGVAGRYRSGSPGIEEDFDVTYWVGAQDGLLHSLTATAPRAGVRERVKLGGLGGLSGAVKLTLELSDYGKPVVVALPGLAFPIHLHSAVPLNDGRVLVTGGFTGVANNNVIVPFPLGFTQIYDPETETWTFLEPLQGRSVLNSAALLGDGQVLIVGLGFDEEGVASIFDPADDSWEPLPDPPASRGAPNIVLLDDGRALAVGGVDAGGSGSFRRRGYLRSGDGRMARGGLYASPWSRTSARRAARRARARRANGGQRGVRGGLRFLVGRLEADVAEAKPGISWSRPGSGCTGGRKGARHRLAERGKRRRPMRRGACRRALQFDRIRNLRSRDRRMDADIPYGAAAH